MKKLGTLLVLMAATGVVSTAVAAPAFTECPAVGHAAGCDILITINATGTATVARDSSQPGYQGFDGTLVAVLNNWSNTIDSLSLSGSRIFALNGNGMCSTGFDVSGNCSQGLNQGDPYDYTGDLVAFSITDLSNGIVNFTGGLASGASAYFSLEGVPTANIVVGSPTAAPPPTSDIPEPATYTLLAGSGLLLLTLSRFLRQR